MKEDFEEMFLVYDLVKDIYVVKLICLFMTLFYTLV